MNLVHAGDDECERVNIRITDAIHYRATYLVHAGDDECEREARSTKIEGKIDGGRYTSVPIRYVWFVWALSSRTITSTTVLTTYFCQRWYRDGIEVS